MKQLALICFFFWSFQSNAQLDYTWFDGVCTYNGTINDELTNNSELDAIVGLLWNPSSLGRPAFMLQPKDSSKISLPLIEKECQNFEKELETAVFPDNPVWDSLRQIRLKEIRRECELKRLAVFAIHNPDTLKSDKQTYKSCKAVVNALSGDQTKLLKTYQEWLGKEEYQKLVEQSPNLDFVAKQAFIDLIRYEWWNCAKESIPSITDHTIIKQEFEKLILDIRKTCK